MSLLQLKLQLKCIFKITIRIQKKMAVFLGHKFTKNPFSFVFNVITFSKQENAACAIKRKNNLHKWHVIHIFGKEGKLTSVLTKGAS